MEPCSDNDPVGVTRSSTHCGHARPPGAKSAEMGDVVALAVIAVFFAVAVLIVRACDTVAEAPADVGTADQPHDPAVPA